MKLLIRLTFPVLLSLALMAAAVDPGAGHWVGTIRIGKKAVHVVVDLARGSSGEWQGTLTLPDQGLTPIAVSNIHLQGGAMSFDSHASLLEVDAKLSADGQSMDGDFLSAFLLHVPVPIHLARTAEAEFERPAPAAALPKDLTGEWEGVVQLGNSWEQDDERSGSASLVRLTFGPDPGGVATGTLRRSAEDQPAALNAIRYESGLLRFEAKELGAACQLRLQDGVLAGDWRELDFDPVTVQFHRPAVR